MSARYLHPLTLAFTLLALPMFCSAAAAAAAGEAKPVDDGWWLLPMELEGDSGAANGNATLLRLLPSYRWPVSDSWNITHLELLLLASAPGSLPGQPGNPEGIGKEEVTGLADWIHASFYTPKPTGNLIVGLGFMASLPVATDDTLGSGKWSAGPALRVTYRAGGWNLGAFGGQLWSFAGDDNRASVSQLIVRGALRRELGENWFAVSAPIITANWNAAADQRWLVPLGGGIGRKFNLAGNPFAISLQGYANVIRPDAAPDWSARLAFTALIPVP